MTPVSWERSAASIRAASTSPLRGVRPDQSLIGWRVTGVWALAICVAAPAAASDRYVIKLIRWEEDYSYLAAQSSKPHGLERLKFIPLSMDRKFWLSLGGQVRNRVDVIDNSQFGLHPVASYTTGQIRILVHADLHVGDLFRAFAQFGYFNEEGRKPVPRPFDISDVDLQQGFLDFSPLQFARLRIGRQELPLGDQRLSEVRDSFNIRRSFDAARIDFQISDLHLMGFWGSPVLNRKGLFDDRPTHGEAFYGVYATVPLEPIGANLDAYWLVREKPNAVFVEGTAKERRATIGARFYGLLASWDYTIQGLVQTGRFGAEHILAYAATSEIGWTATSWPWHPRFGIRADFGSGDRRLGDDTLNSFDAPYPNTSYFSLTSAYWPGNAWSLFPILVAQPTDETTIFLGAQYVARLSLQDGFYYQPETPILLTGVGARGLMSQGYGRIRWEPSRHWTISGLVLYQVAGTATRTVHGKDVAIGSVSIDWRF
jgi:hypothetical protein